MESSAKENKVFNAAFLFFVIANTINLICLSPIIQYLFGSSLIYFPACFPTIKGCLFCVVPFCDVMHLLKIKQGPYGFWKVVEIENAIFQDPGKFWKREDFQNGYGKFLDFYMDKF